jgi:hypothetical protein
MHQPPINNQVHASCSILMMFIISLRSLWHSVLMIIDRLLFALACRLRNLLKKWWTKGIAIPRCPRRPMMLSTSFAVVFPCWMTMLMRFVHAMNLFVSSCTRSRLVSRNHPRMVFCSSNPASAWSLFRAFMSLRGLGSLGCFGQAQVSMARRVARSHRIALSVLSMTTVAGLGHQCKRPQCLLD